MPATLVSFVPLDIEEEKIGIFPSNYNLRASDGSTPELLVVQDAKYYIETWQGEDKTLFPVPQNAVDLANAICLDYRNSMIGVEEHACPAFFAVAEEVDVDKLMKKFKATVDNALLKQKNWFDGVIRRADDVWEKYHQHRMISDLDRIVASVLRLDRPWMGTIKQLSTCPACFNSVDPKQALCGNCRCIINKAAYDSLQFALKV